MDQLTQTLNDTPEKIALFLAKELKDLLQAVPAFRAIRRAFPQAQICLISFPEYQEVGQRYAAYVDEFIPFPGHPGLSGRKVKASEVVHFFCAMQQRKWDVLLSLQEHGSTVNHMLMLAGAKLTAGYFEASIAEMYEADDRFFIPFALTASSNSSPLQLVASLGIPVENDAVEFPLFAEDEGKARQAWPEWQQKSFICIHPDGDTSHQWPASHYAWLTRKLASEGYPTVLTGLHGRQRTLEEVKRLVKDGEEPAPVIIDQTDLGSLGWIIKQSSLLVSNNCAVTQMAKALQVPSVVITNDWKPEQSEKHVVLSEQAAVNLNTVISTLMNLLKDN
ncbi:ADP-heptose:LPS heptosyltransferase [Siphonobacter sp. SORGH_AS 1065]|nr:ADP-heptose:LPS heptosyltransferase [Siphonobacter sp. SORGH_AS_1065]